MTSPEQKACKSILIVEDDEEIRNALRYAIELEGYQVFTASNGKEGLEMLPRMPRPCLILLDLMMPVMNGWDFATALQEDMSLAPIPIIVVTAYSERAKPVRAMGVVKKPVDLDVLFRIINRWCGSATPSRSAFTA